MKAKTVKLKAKTVKRLAILIAILSLVGGTSVFSRQLQLERLGRIEIAKAEIAAKKGNFVEAELLFRQYLEIFPDDVGVKIKRADALLKVTKSPDTQSTALRIYNDILTQNIGRRDVRRLRAKLRIDMGHFVSGAGSDQGANADLQILLDGSPEDGELHFLMGQCYEARGEERGDDPQDIAKAVAEYQKAIEYKARQKIDASERLAMLLRNKLGQPEKAKQVIDWLVKWKYPVDFSADRVAEKAKQVIDLLVTGDPDNYRVYLARGRYILAVAARDQSPKSLLTAAKKDFEKARDGSEPIADPPADLTAAKKDFEKARDKAPKEPEVYLALAEAVANPSKSNDDEVRRILEDGQKKAPEAAKIYNALASIELRAGKTDKAIEVLENGLKSATDPSQLRVFLTYLLAEHGDTDKLLLQIKDLKRFGYSQSFIQFFTAYYCINANEFLKARQLLLTLPGGAQSSDLRFKARVNVLLALCYRHLSEPEMERDALLRAFSADPQNMQAHLGWIANLASQGNIDGAIEEYRSLVNRVPRVRLVLARLLIAQNQRRPEPERNWNEVKELIEQAPQSSELVVLRAEVLVAQGNPAAARDTLEKGRTQFPKSVDIRITLADVLRFQGRIPEALAVIDQLEKELGDSVDLRLGRAALWEFKKGSQVVEDLVHLGDYVEKFSKPDRERLLKKLAAELFLRHQNLEKASHLLARLAKEDPNNLELRLTLFDLALQSNNNDEIENIIKQIKEIEGNDGLHGLHCQVRYLLWQAKRADDKAIREAKRLQARAILGELLTRRGDWSVIPLALATLEEQELEDVKQSGVSEAKIKAKEETIIGLYQQAIKLGQHDSAIVRKTVELLLKNGRSSDALELPLESQLAREVGHQVANIAVEKREFERAEQIARKTVDARPDDFLERFWLVKILLASNRQNAAGKELRKAVDLSPKDPVRWVALTKFMIFTKQLGEAENIIQEAEEKLPPLLRPTALAECCEKLGQAYENGPAKADVKKWYDAARKWYEQAQTDHPEDLSIKLSLAGFLLRTNQISDAESYLDAMRQGGSAETVAWATRERALMYARAQPHPELSKALALFKPNGKPVPAGQEGKARKDPEDLRVIVRILNLEKTLVHRKRAIEILETLANNNPEDRFLLAHLYDVTGDWPKARLNYRELDLSTRNPKDMETVNRRPLYLAQYVESLLQHREPDDKEDLSEAQQLVDDIKRLQPNALETFILQVQIYRARKQIDPAVKLIREFAARPDVTPQVLVTLADLAEKIEQVELAEGLYRQIAALPGIEQRGLPLAAFLGRHRQTKDALDICKPPWPDDPKVVQQIASTCINILYGSDNNTRTPDLEHFNRVAGWFEQAITQAQSQRRPYPWLFVGLGNLHERQGNYSKAKQLYQRAFDEGEREGISLNNLAWLAALNDRNVKDALDYANRALNLKPGHPEYLDTRGVIYLKAHNPQLALDDLLRAVDLDPSAPSKLFHLAQAQLANNDKENAKLSFEIAKAKGLTPNNLDPVLERKDYQVLVDELGSP